MADFHRLKQRALNEIEEVLSRIDEGNADELADEIVAAQRIFVAGAGRSGLAVRGYAMRLAHLGFTVHVVGDVTTPPIKAHDLLIAVSGSGTTATILQIAKKARSLGARVACITTKGTSPLAELCACTIVLPASTPKAEADEAPDLVRSEQPLANLFEQCSWLFGDIHISILRDRLNEDNESMMSRHANLE